MHVAQLYGNMRTNSFTAGASAPGSTGGMILLALGLWVRIRLAIHFNISATDTGTRLISFNAGGYYLAAVAQLSLVFLYHIFPRCAVRLTGAWLTAPFFVVRLLVSRWRRRRLRVKVVGIRLMLCRRGLRIGRMILLWRGWGRRLSLRFVFHPFSIKWIC
jgi:hypothetical protein